jgi:rhodanese-related sulfurtransferase
MNKLKILAVLFLTFAIVFTSCKKEEPEVINEAEVLIEYLESANSPGADYTNTNAPSIISATDLKTALTAGQAYVIDIRSAADFATGHIDGAHNVALADALTHIESLNMASYTKVAIVCYTGQTAGFVASLAQLLGYDKVFALKWGMASWHSDFAGKWNTNISNTYATQFVTTSTAKGAAGELPVLSTGFETGQEILEARVDEVLTEGFTEASITAATVFGALSNYYIVNYWPAEHYANPGHIPGAMQYTPKEALKLAADLKTLPTNKTIVVYCYTGQNSANLAAYLRVLGYDAKSLLFGANGMIYDMLTPAGISAGSIWSAANSMEYDYVQ